VQKLKILPASSPVYPEAEKPNIANIDIINGIITFKFFITVNDYSTVI
tara:strand:- start:94 stop:237 length:144 start_codon:yes stop_codon:yes gene_type:complete